MRFFAFLFFLLTLIFARENPFVPSDIIKKFEAASNEKSIYPPFDLVKVSLPSDARILKEIVIKYQNVDGSESFKTISVNASIDWHNPIIITQKRQMVLKDFNQSKIAKNQSQKENRENKTKKTSISKSFSLNRFLNIKIDGKKIYIFTKKRKIRDFMVIKPYKIILDFKTLEDVSYRSVKTSLPFVKKVVVGNHIGYFRVVFELDGNYKYLIKKISGGYLLLLN